MLSHLHTDANLFVELLLSTMGIFLCLHYATAASCELFHLAVNSDVLCEGGGWVSVLCFKKYCIKTIGPGGLIVRLSAQIHEVL